MSTNH